MAGPSASLWLVAALLALRGLASSVQAASLLEGMEDVLNPNQPAPKSNSSQPEWPTNTTCGYESCPRLFSNMINVHIVAHSHDDVGWLKTVDQYYYGTKKSHSPVGVQYILDSLIPQLVMDKSKRFIYVEMSFFSKWWAEQSEPMRKVVRRLVDEGRLEFINGGWCMNDEATVSYRSTIEQMTVGLKFLEDTFGRCARPKVGWQIDPFGHTNEQASLFAQFGFDGMYFTRIGYRDKEMRIRDKSLDLLWRADEALPGQSGAIFTNIFRDGYDTPGGFCFDVMCQDDELVDNKNSYEYNIDQKAQRFIQVLRDFAKIRLTNNILVPFGGDFHFSAAGQNFKNIDKLIKYVRNNATDINIFYSTPSCYQYAVHKSLNSSQSNKELPQKYDDFMVYDSTSTNWWSGYFTSRPSVKLVERDVANMLHVVRMLSIAHLSTIPSNQQRLTEMRLHDDHCLNPLWEVLGDLQHHDAVTGTEKQHVTDDYVRRSSDAIAACTRLVGRLRRDTILANIIKDDSAYKRLEHSGQQYSTDAIFLEQTQLCPLLNISQCDPVESEIDLKRFKQATNGAQTKPLRANSEVPSELKTRATLMTVYNPLARAVEQHDIRLPCNARCDLDKITIMHLASRQPMRLVRLPVSSGVLSLPFRDALTTYEVMFQASLPALGHASFVIEDSNSDKMVEDDGLDESMPEVLEVVDASAESHNNNNSNNRRPDVRGRRTGRSHDSQPRSEHLLMGGSQLLDFLRNDDLPWAVASPRRPSPLSDQILLEVDRSSGMLISAKRMSDRASIDLSQKFGYYFPANQGPQPGAYIFRPNTSEPILLDKPIYSKIYKRQNGAMAEIHQKWSNWLWQTIRVDSRKNYIEFDYIVGPIPITSDNKGREVVTRYMTNIENEAVFLTDSNDRQLLPRRRLRTEEPEQLGGSFYPVVSTIVLLNANTSDRSPNSPLRPEAIAIQTDRSQAGTSLHEGQIEMLIHRRHTRDDNWGVGEPLNEPGEDGRGLVTRGTHRLYLKFPTTNRNLVDRTMNMIHPAANLTHELAYTAAIANPATFAATTKINTRDSETPKESQPPKAKDRYVYMIHDSLFDDLKTESVKQLMKPLYTFDRLRARSNRFESLLSQQGKADFSLLNNSLPANVHLLTLQAWKGNQLLIRLENLENPLTVQPALEDQVRASLLKSLSKVETGPSAVADTDECRSKLRPKTTFSIVHLLRQITIEKLEEMTLGANMKLSESERLKWGTDQVNSCDDKATPENVSLIPRQIRTFIAEYRLS